MTDSTDSQYDSATYTSEQVSDVIRIALRNSKAGNGDAIRYKEILAIGADFGLTDADIRNAFDEIAVEAEVSRAKDKGKSDAVMGFKIHLLTFLVISAGLLVLNLVISPSVIWAMYPFIMWGSVVALHGLMLRFTPEIAVALSELDDDNEDHVTQKA